MNKLIEAKAFQIGEYWYICARLPLEEGDTVVLPKNSPTPEVKIVSPSNILLKEQQVENEIRASYEGIIKDLKKRLDEKGDIILSVDDLHKKEIAKIRQHYEEIIAGKDKKISQLSKTHEQKLAEAKKELEEAEAAYYKLIKKRKRFLFWNI